MIANVAVYSTAPECEERANAFAAKLNLPFTLTQQTNYDYLLVITPDYIGLQKTASSSRPLYIDFLAGKMNYRSKHTSIKKEALARAMGLKNKTNPKIVDATGGLAGDAFTLAALGFNVTLLERSRIIHALVVDGLQRAQKIQSIATCVNRIELIHTDAIHWLELQKTQARSDIIYLDPMFPERKKSSLPRREMLILQDIVGDDADSSELLQAALACAAQRVVVKRPRLAPALVEHPASTFSLSGSSSRFDVYVI